MLAYIIMVILVVAINMLIIMENHIINNYLKTADPQADQQQMHTHTPGTIGNNGLSNNALSQDC